MTVESGNTDTSSLEHACNRGHWAKADAKALPLPSVLLVDDSAVNRAILSKILSEHYRVLQAENGRLALT
ncbi:MAG: hypothetical protein RRY53_01745, partial [Pseudoflavonifractor sp.]